MTMVLTRLWEVQTRGTWYLPSPCPWSPGLELGESFQQSDLAVGWADIHEE